MECRIAIAGNARVEEEDVLSIALVILMRTSNMVSEMTKNENEVNDIVFYLSMQPMYKELNKALINVFNMNGLKWRYFKNSFFHTPRSERKTTRKGVIILTTPMTSMKDMTMMDFLNDGIGKDVSVVRDTILVEDELTKAVKYVKLKESYSFEEMIVLEVNKLGTLF